MNCENTIGHAFIGVLIVCIVLLFICAISWTINKDIERANKNATYQTELFLYQSALNELLGKSRDFAQEYGYYITQYVDRTDKDNPRISFEFYEMIITHAETLHSAQADSFSWGNK